MRVGDQLIKELAMPKNQELLRDIDPDGYNVLCDILLSASTDSVEANDYLNDYASVDLTKSSEVSALILRDCLNWSFAPIFPLETSELDLSTQKGQFFQTMARIIPYVINREEFRYDEELFGHWYPIFCYKSGGGLVSIEEINLRTRMYLQSVFGMVFGRDVESTSAPKI